jgi:AdoMet-dependent heme synthase
MANRLRDVLRMRSFDDAPLLVIWEATQACDPACAHCRASAAPRRHASELTTKEGIRLLDQIRDFGNPLMVFTGGDPLKRPDLFLLLQHSVALGLRTNVSPGATPLLTREAIRQFKDCGVARMSISLDSVPETFDRAMEALEEARGVGLDTQVQTTVTRRNMHRLDGIAALVEQVKARMWSVFFLVAAGRTAAGDELSGDEYEQLLEKLHEISLAASFEVRTTGAMHYRRHLSRRMGDPAALADPARTMWRTAGVSDARGLVFVSHTGEIYPSGFLPISVGNVRIDSLASVYRNSALFRELPDADGRHGKPGAYEYRKLCRGFRARAFALTGHSLAERSEMHLPAEA